MAETGSSQFVMARSAVCGTSGLICLLMVLTLVETHIRKRLEYKVGYGGTPSSSYKWSTNYIMIIIQSAGVALGSIAPLSRWFMAARFKSSKIGSKRFKEELKIEAYWTQKLVEWRESSLPLQIRHFRFRKFLHGAKRLLLNVAIRFQILIVLASKLVLLISATVDAKTFLFFHRIKKFGTCAFGNSNDTRAGSSAVAEQDLSQYVLILEGESELSQKTLANICNEVDKLIQKGKKQQPKNLIKLLQKSVSFNGVREFDSNEVPSLHSQEPPRSWSLTVVTLTSITIALPNISNHKAKWLLKAVSEGLSSVKIIETTFDRKGEFLHIRNAADVTWVEVELYQIWQDKVLHETSPRDRTHKETLQELSLIAEKAVFEFKTSSIDSRMENPHNWPAKIIAANAMYWITRTILLVHSNHQTDKFLFEKLSVTISDILAACLTNLSRVITMKCHNDASKEREENVSQAAILLGESEQILEILRHHQSPGLNPVKAAQIEEWRASTLGLNPTINGQHESIEVER